MTIKTFIKKVIKKLRGGRITLRPASKSRGRVLLSYKTEPFFDFKKKEHIHTNIWECREIAKIFLRLGYTVDVIDWFDHKYKPQENYKYFIDLGLNLERMAPMLNKDCIKIFHTTTSHWFFNNNAELERLSNLETRRGVKLRPRRALPPAKNIEIADFATLLGNAVTESTYAFAKKKMHYIPLSTTHTYPFLENKNMEKAKNSFIWLGGVGMVHKGLDLVLEAFARLPEYKLFVCGDVQGEKDFEKLYWNELYNTENIKALGKVDLGGNVFKDIVSASIALIYPSCSEGQSGAVITSMHAGLIPAISYHSGVDVGDFGFIIKENTVEGVMEIVRDIASLPDEELKGCSRRAWEYATKNHTRERYSEEFAKFVKMIESKKLRPSMEASNNNSILSVDTQKWQDAQQFERSVWVSGNQKNSPLRVVMKFVRAFRKSPQHFFKLLAYRDFYAGDDWNFWWKDKFDNYKLLPKHINKALEVGSGPYTNIRIIAKIKKIDEVHCVDPLMDLYLSFKLNWLSVMAKKGKISTYTGKGEELKFQDNSFDLVVCNNVLDHVQDTNACLSEIHRVLKLGGYFVFGQDLSNQEDIAKQRIEDRGFVGHPIKLDERTLNELLDGLYEVRMKKVLPREEGRNPRHHYGTYLFIGIKK